MADSFLMKNHQGLEDLFRNLSRVRSRRLLVFDIFAEVSVWDILHSKEDVVLVFVPAVELDKQVPMLHIVSS